MPKFFRLAALAAVVCLLLGCNNEKCAVIVTAQMDYSPAYEEVAVQVRDIFIEKFLEIIPDSEPFSDNEVTAHGDCEYLIDGTSCYVGVASGMAENNMGLTDITQAGQKVTLERVDPVSQSWDVLLTSKVESIIVNKYAFRVRTDY